MASRETKYAHELVATLAQTAADKKLLGAFLVDLLTPAEYREIAFRWQIIKMLYAGMPQREVAEKLGVSVATVSRGARELKDPKGGFLQALAKLGDD